MPLVVDRQDWRRSGVPRAFIPLPDPGRERVVARNLTLSGCPQPVLASKVALLLQSSSMAKSFAKLLWYPRPAPSASDSSSTPCPCRWKTRPSKPPPPVPPVLAPMLIENVTRMPIASTGCFILHVADGMAGHVARSRLTRRRARARRHVRSSTGTACRASAVRTVARGAIAATHARASTHQAAK